jgi:uncharacterized protein
MSIITTLKELERIYGQPGETSTVKELDRVTPHYRALIEASPFAALATSGPEGLDCPPRGDVAGFVRVHDERTLMIPDRRGNNRVDSLRNIVRDPRATLLFLIPGVGNTLRVNGSAHVTINSDLLASFVMDGKSPRSVIVFAVEAIYFQCASAIVRSELWNPERHVDPKSCPAPDKSWPRSAMSAWAASIMTTPCPSGRDKRCGDFRLSRSASRASGRPSRR